MEHKIKRIGVLTSGGDAPGMNAAVRAAARNCVNYGITPIGIHRGYSGLLHSDVIELNSRSVDGILNRGGTMLYTARCEEFKTPEGIARGAAACKYLGLDGLIAIGGDGTFRGAQKLSEAGIPVIGIPATIDNDISCSHYTIGFDSAANTAISAIDKLSDTMQSHERVSVVEVMGRNAGHLAIYIGLSVGATATLIPEKPYDLENDVLEKIRAGKYHNKNHYLIIVAEGVGKTTTIAKKIEEETGLETRISILGYIQRGGSPSARDRAMASRMGHFAVEQFVAGNPDTVICYRDSRLQAIPIPEAFSMKKDLDSYMYQVAYDISI